MMCVACVMQLDWDMHWVIVAVGFVCLCWDCHLGAVSPGLEWNCLRPGGDGTSRGVGHHCIILWLFEMQQENQKILCRVSFSYKNNDLQGAKHPMS